MSQRNFSTVVGEVVKRLDSFFVTQSASKPYGDKETLVAHLDQVVFSVGESNKTKLTATNNLETANEICLYCTRQKAEYVRYCVFDALFSMTRPAARENRRNALTLTASLAIALESTPVLECIALWLATTPREHAIYLASSLEEDFCTIMPESASELKAINKISERFTTMLIAAFCTKYNSRHMKDSIALNEYPPPLLLEVVQQWTLANPKSIFSVISRIDQVWHTVLTTTRNPAECLPLSPLAGLIKWSVQLPFAPEDCYNIDSFNIDTQVQSKLHYAVLLAITQSQNCRSVISQGILGNESNFQLWNKSDAHALVGILLSYTSNGHSSDKMTSAVDRFAQVSQVAMTYSLLTIAKEQFQSLTDPLPQTKLLELVAYGTDKRIEDIHMT